MPSGQAFIANGHTLIAAGGKATRSGGGACLGGSKGLAVAFGGHAATTLNPPTMPCGAIDVTIYCQNGGGSAGTQIPR